MTVDRIGIHFGTFTIFFYAIIILIGVLVACYLTSRRAKEIGQDPDTIWDLAVWILILGIIGARLWHVLLPSASQVANGITTQFYLTHPLDAINIRAGGLGIPGAVIGGVLAAYIFTRIKKLQFSTWLDLVAPGLILAQAIGRWGNFVNQELYGAPSTLPWAIYIDEAYRLPEFKNFSTYHPLFLYECLWNLATFFFLLYVEKQFREKLKSGDLFLVYLICYPIGRFLLEFLRLDTAQVMGIDFNQYSMLVVALLSAIALGIRHWKQTNPPQEIDSITSESETETGSESESEKISEQEA